MFNFWQLPEQIVTCSNMTQGKNIAAACTSAHVFTHMVCTQFLWRQHTQKQASVLNPAHTNILFHWPLCIIDEPSSIRSAILSLLSSLPPPIPSVVWYLSTGVSLTPRSPLSALSRRLLALLLFHLYPSFPIILLLSTYTFSPHSPRQLDRPVIPFLLRRRHPVIISREGWGRKLTVKFDCQVKNSGGWWEGGDCHCMYALIQ